MQESASFWTDIKNLGEQLGGNPDSLCFARLSDVYLKVGLIDDALHVARQGVLRHPRYLSGQRALSLACHAKGLNDEALAALKMVVEALPEDVSSQKLLGRLSAEAGDQEAACRAFRTALEFSPEDVESRIELEALERSAGERDYTAESDDDIIEDLEILEELEILEDDQDEADYGFNDVPLETGDVSTPQHDPLSTGTLAELYVSQGFIHKALEIYRAILADSPDDRVTAGRIAELEALDAGTAEAEPEIDETVTEESPESEDESVYSSLDMSALPENEPETPEVFEFENPLVASAEPLQQIAPAPVPQDGIADNALVELEGWLENIRRIKSCR